MAPALPPSAPPPAAADAEDGLGPEDFWQTEPGGDLYKGPRNDKGQAHGHGMLKFKSGEYYEGQLVNDKMDGYGKHKWPSGAEYDGEWDNDERQGFGKYVFADGGVYVGRFKKSLREGAKGKYTWKNGEVYEGGFKNDHLEGQGTFLWASGRMDLCTYSKGKPTGEGVRARPASSSSSHPPGQLPAPSPRLMVSVAEPPAKCWRVYQIRWSIDRKVATRLLAGNEGEAMDLEEATVAYSAFEAALLEATAAEDAKAEELRVKKVEKAEKEAEKAAKKKK